MIWMGFSMVMVVVIVEVPGTPNTSPAASSMASPASLTASMPALVWLTTAMAIVRKTPMFLGEAGIEMVMATPHILRASSRRPMSKHLKVDISSKGDWSVVAVTGEVDLATAPSLRRAFEDAAESSDAVLADLSGVSFMDSTGLRVLIAAHQGLEAAGGKFAVVPGDGAVARLLDITGVDDHIAMYENVTEAVAG